MTIHFPFDNSYARLDGPFFVRVPPTTVAAPQLVALNAALAVQIGLDPEALSSSEGAEILAGKRVPEGAEPLAAAYAGHQFGSFVPQLGDGRAVLLGEVVGQDGQRRDIQLKGSGPTPFSRRGDGRAALGPVLREYIVSEAMAALGVPTTRALAAATTGEWVLREEPLPGAVLTRVAASHIRIGTFQFFAARGDTAALKRLADYVVARHYPQVADTPNVYRSLLDAIIARQAALVARWMLIGFVHGVMNTDNMSIAGETIDYGPCAFMDAYHPMTVFSSIDRNGRYAYANQPGVAVWNLTRLAEALLPLLDSTQDKAVEQANEALSAFAKVYERHYLAGLRRKLGLLTDEAGDLGLAHDLLQRMSENKADFTLTFRRLSACAVGSEGDADVRILFDMPLAFDEWVGRWRDRLAHEDRSGAARKAAMDQVNPAFIPRNHLVEAALQAAVADQNFGPFEVLVAVLARPYQDQPDFAAYADPPLPHQQVFETFCGT
jgi:serine/tyrosine/threonine adenylyltransferase